MSVWLHVELESTLCDNYCTGPSHSVSCRPREWLAGAGVSVAKPVGSSGRAASLKSHSCLEMRLCTCQYFCPS